MPLIVLPDRFRMNAQTEDSMDEIQLPPIPEGSIFGNGVYDYCEGHLTEYARTAVMAERSRIRALAEKWRMEAEQLRRQAGASQRRGDLSGADVLFMAAQDADGFADDLIQVIEGREP